MPQACTTAERLLGEDLERPMALIDSLLPDEVKGFVNAGPYWLPKGTYPLRAALVLLVGRRYGAPESRQIEMAAAVEMIYYASLLHERLGKMRSFPFNENRGLEILHRMESMDVLLGDFFFARAASLIVADGSQEIIEDMLTTSMRSAELQAQILSFDASGPVLDIDECFSAISGKLSLILSLSTRVGACLGNASERDRKILSRYGEVLGRAVRIMEDVRFWRNPSKARMSEPLEPSFTYPALLLRRDCPDEKAHEDLRLVGSEPSHTSALERLSRLLVSQGYLDRSINRATDYTKEACRHLEALPFSAELVALKEIACALCADLGGR